MAEPIHSTTSLRENNAQPYKSMQGKLNPQLLKGLEVMGFEYMTPVQSKVLTDLPSFRSDCLVQAKTGTGKTIAFLLPALHSLLSSPPLPKGQVGILIISPTRELALQIAKECDHLTLQLSKPLECHTAFGDMTARASNLHRFINGSPSILVATPGRLKDYLSERPVAAKFANIQTLVLDEADTMLESGFLADVTEVLKHLPHKSTGWQGMCFSATIPEKIKDVIHRILHPGYTSISTIDKNEQPTLERVNQYHVLMPSVKDTFITLMALLDHESVSATSSKIIVFGVTANMVALYAKVFAQGLTSLKIYELHSRLNQNLRTRTTDEFKAASSGLMFASDVIGRGMDFPNVDLVVQVGLPGGSNGEQYVHRVGRTARADKDGRAIIILTSAESFFLARNRQLPILPHQFTQQIVELGVALAPQMEQAMYRVDEIVKKKAYSSFIGFFAGSGLLKPLGLDKVGLVKMANELALRGMHCPEPPPMDKQTIGKMGLKGVTGFTYASNTMTDCDNSSRHQHPPSHGGRPILKPKYPGAVEKNGTGRDEKKGGGNESRENRKGRHTGRRGRGGKAHGITGTGS
ncbi:hypothetical protein MMC13_001147 [Lambiella insularis]|nr:hypothetical protein [Lambiella insularis]